MPDIFDNDMDDEYTCLEKALTLLKEYSSGTEDEISKDLEYVAGMLHMMQAFGYEAWNEGGKWSIRSFDSGRLLVDKDKIVV